MKVNTEKLSVSNERLSIIGRLIGIYREERRDNSQNSWTQKRFCKDICSPNTLKNIEAGGLSRSIEIYVEMLDKFDLKLGEFPEIDKAVYRLAEELYEAIEFYNNDKIDEVILRALRVLSEVKCYTYYHDLRELFDDLRSYYINDDYISYEKVSKYKQIMFVLPNQFKDFYRILIFAKMKPECTSTKNDIGNLVASIRLEEAEHTFLYINLLQYYFIMENYKMMDTSVNKLVNHFESKGNSIRLSDVLNYAIVLTSYIAMNECEVYIKKLHVLLDNSPIPLLKIGEASANIALAYYVNKDYAKALLYFEEMEKYPYLNSLDKFVLMADCQNRLDKKINIPLVEEKDFLKFPLEIKVLYKYFTFDESIPLFAKENYILKRILNHLQHDVYIDIFRFELLKLIDQTNHYKVLHVFDTRVKNLKN